jgi:hypothetical protein
LDAEAAGLDEWSAIKVECRKGCVTAFSNARSGEISLETHEPGFRKLPIVAELSTADDKDATIHADGTLHSVSVERN